MTLESIVTSLELSRKLQEAGFEVETYFWWLYKPACKESVLKTGDISPQSKLYGCGYPELHRDGVIYPAYTFQQLWEVLPRKIEPGRELYLYKIDSADRGDNDMIGYSDMIQMGDTWTKLNLPDAAAQAALWCIENGYLNVKESK